MTTLPDYIPRYRGVVMVPWLDATRGHAVVMKSSLANVSWATPFYPTPGEAVARAREMVDRRCSDEADEVMGWAKEMT
jgi:hypothetical protein